MASKPRLFICVGMLNVDDAEAGTTDIDDADADAGADDPAHDADGAPFLLFLPPQRDR